MFKFSFNKEFNFLVYCLLFLVLITSLVIAGGITPDELSRLSDLKDKIKQGYIDDLLVGLDETNLVHTMHVFRGLDNSCLINAWDKMEVKEDGKVDLEKTNNYRQMLLAGVCDGKGALDSFISDLMKRNFGLTDFEFKGSDVAGSLRINGDFLDLKDDEKKIHKIPLKDLKGIKEIVFHKMKKGGKGYAVYYGLDYGENSGAFLSSGYLKKSKDGYEVIDLFDGGVKSRGYLSFGDNPRDSIYFRGLPRGINQEVFSNGDYIFHKPGRGKDISFSNELGILESSKRDTFNKEGYRVGYQSETGIRGVKKIDFNKDKKIDLIIDIAYENNLGIEYEGNVIGSKSSKIIKINNKGEDVEVLFPLQTKNTQITNNNGKVFSKYDSKEYYSGENQAMKIINGKVNGIFVNRQDKNAGNSEGDRISFEEDKEKENFQDSFSNLFNKQDSNEQDSKEDNNNLESVKNPLEISTYNFINQYRGSNLQWDEQITEICRQHSIRMANRGYIGHDGFSSRVNQIGRGAENVAMFGSHSNLTPEDVGKRFAKMWMNSPGHHRNIMGRWGKTGVGISVKDSGNGYKEYYATQIFF